MTEYFADTFYWLALMNVDDAYHERVVAANIRGRLVMTRAIQIEVLDALSNERYRPLAIHFWESCADDTVSVIVSLDDDLLKRSMEFFRGRPDKNWSFTDCISFVVMKERNITEALTGDHHFEQAGFHAIFKD